MGYFSVFDNLAPLASLVVTVALRRYCQTIAHAQMVNVCPEQFFATTYGLGVRAQKVSFWAGFRENKLSPVAQSLYSVRTMPAYKSSLPWPWASETVPSARPLHSVRSLHTDGQCLSPEVFCYDVRFRG